MRTVYKHIAILSMIFGMQAASAQITQDRTPGEFTGIKAGNTFDIEIVKGEPLSVKIEAPDKEMADKIIMEVKEGVLEISLKEKVRSLDDVKIRLTMKTLTGVELNGAANLKSLDSLGTDKLTINTTGAANVTLLLKANEVKVNADGASNIKLSGKAQMLGGQVSGAAQIKTKELACERVSMQVSGAGSAKVNATRHIDADVSGAGSLRYSGDPTEKNINVSGAGSAKRMMSDGKTQKDTTHIRFSGMNIDITPGLHNEEKDGDNDHGPHRDKHAYGSHKDHDKPKLDDFAHWQGFDIGVNGWMAQGNNISMPANYDYLSLNYARSLSFAWNIVDINIPIYRHYVQIVTGMGVEWNGYNFRNPITLDPNSSNVSYRTDSLVNFSKNKLKETFFNVPLLLQFNTNNRNPDRSFHLAAGMTFGYKINSKTKQNFSSGGYDFEVKNSDDYLLAPFRASATVRAGYGSFTLFANYALTELFDKGRGPQVFPFSMGICIGY